MPREIARRAEQVGVDKTRRPAAGLFALAVLAGAFIALGAMLATTVLAGAETTVPFGLARLAAGIAFSLGLILVVVGGAELFTGNALMTIALAAGRISVGELLRAWVIVYLGNLVGAVGTAALVFLSGQYAIGNGLVAEVAVQIAVQKALLPFDRALFLGVLCNVLVCLAVWLALGARSSVDKVAVIVFPVAAFVAAGFEHSVANMYVLPLGMLIVHFGDPQLVAGLTLPSAALAALRPMALIDNLVPVTLGNIIGGGVLVGLVYWFVYLRER